MSYPDYIDRAAYQQRKEKRLGSFHQPTMPGRSLCSTKIMRTWEEKKTNIQPISISVSEQCVIKNKTKESSEPCKLKREGLDPKKICPVECDQK